MLWEQTETIRFVFHKSKVYSTEKIWIDAVYRNPWKQ